MRLVGELLALAAVVMGLSHTIAKEKMFESVRQAADRRAEWLGYVLSCPFCLSYWLSFVLVPLCRAYYFGHVALGSRVAAGIVNWFLSCVLVVTVAAFLRVAFFFIDETQGLVRRRQRMADLKVEREEHASPTPPVH